MILVVWDGPGKEGEDLGSNDADKTDDGEGLSDFDFFEGEPEANKEENYGNNTDRVPEVGEPANFAYSPDAAVLAGDHRDETDDEGDGEEDFSFHLLISCLFLVFRSCILLLYHFLVFLG